ncbi:hypothetical protein N9D59_08010, partial [Burkholderiaceae bacterium]|nr:hypothetical protein [Burkholderiaceae bacterium]
PATGDTSYSDVDFEITLTPVTVGGKLVQEIIVETLDGTPISSAGFAELMSSIVVDYDDKTAAAAAPHNIAFDMVLSTRGEAGATWFEAADGDTNRSILSFENEPLTAAYAAFNGEYLEVSFKQISDGDPREITGSDDEWNGWMGDPSSDLFTVTVNGTAYAGANGEVEVLMSDGSLLLMLPGVEMAPGADVSVTYVDPAEDQIYEVLQRWNGQDVSSFTIAAEHSNSPVTRTMLADAQAGWSNIDNFLSDDAEIALPGIGLGGVSAPITAISGGDVTVEIIGSMLAGNPVFDASATDGYAQYEWAAEALQVTLSGLDLSARGVGDEVSLLELFSDGVRFSSVLEGAYGANGPNDDSGEVFYFIQHDVSGVGLSTYQFASSELGVTWGGGDF